jgi:hypothetical protein
MREAGIFVPAVEVEKRLDSGLRGMTKKGDDATSFLFVMPAQAGIHVLLFFYGAQRTRGYRLRGHDEEKTGDKKRNQIASTRSFVSPQLFRISPQAAPEGCSAGEGTAVTNPACRW